MVGAVWRFAGASFAALALSACNFESDTGFIEIKTVPISLATVLPLYLGSEKLDTLKKGNAVLRQRVGTARLQIEAGNGSLAPLCDLVVKKNRITTVTISSLERPPRCQCERTGNDSKACIG